MDDELMIKQWDSFAKTISGTIQTSKANYLNRDNYYKISTDKTDVELTWGNQPQRGRGVYVTLESKFRYKLNENNSIKLKVQPQDFFSKLFSTNKQRFGIKDLDNSYSFFCNSSGLSFQLTDTFKDFHNFNTYKHFLIETERITEKPTLTIFIPELITTKDKLSSYYNFGLRIAKVLSADT